MSEYPANHNSPDFQPESYEVHIQGVLDPRWSEWLGSSRVTHTPAGNTILACQLPDQTALHGLLAKIRDMNLKLISVTRVESASADEKQNHDYVSEA